MTKMEIPVSDGSYYDRDYFESGPTSGKSLYEDYHWIPELTIPLAKLIKEHIDKRFGPEILNDKAMLDFGCAKGFLVKAFRLIGVNCYGVDISEYAIRSAPEDLDSFVSHIKSDLNHPKDWPSFDWVVAKDVLEHFPYDDIDEVLSKLREKAENIFAVIPLGNGSNYYIAEYEEDKSHFIRQDLEWWKNRFRENGFDVEATYDVGNLKAKWAEHHHKGNGLFISKP